MKNCSTDNCEARLHQNNSKWIEAEKACPEEAVEFCTHANYIRAFVANMYGNKEQALSYINKALELNPDWAEAHYFKGNILAYMCMHDIATIPNSGDLALESYENCIQLENNAGELADKARYSIVDVCKFLGRLRLAIYCLQKIESKQFAQIALIDIAKLKEEEDYLSSSASMPGRVPFSMNSKVAPPPVET